MMRSITCCQHLPRHVSPKLLLTNSFHWNESVLVPSSGSEYAPVSSFGFNVIQDTIIFPALESSKCLMHHRIDTPAYSLPNSGIYESLISILQLFNSAPPNVLGILFFNKVGPQWRLDNLICIYQDCLGWSPMCQFAWQLVLLGNRVKLIIWEHKHLTRRQKGCKKKYVLD